MIVDDDPNLRTLLTTNLQAEGYGVSAAESGTQAILLLQSGQPDLVILDVMMPGKDGWEVCKWIRDHEGAKPIKVVMLTARDTPRDRLIGRDLLHADEYITKPFDVDALMRRIKELTGEITA